MQAVIGSGSIRRAAHSGKSREAWLFMLIVLIAIFEGAVRKWAIPALGTPLMLLRDVFAAWIVIEAASKGVFRRAPLLAQSFAAWSALVIGWGLLQLLINQTPTWIFLLGLRFWLLYLWMALAVAVSLSEQEFRWVLRSLLWVLMGMAVLAAVQFKMPAGHWINFQPDTPESEIFTAAMGIVRTSGTFSFTLGYTCFIALVAPFALVGGWRGIPLLNTSRQRFIAMLAIAIASLVCGSRAGLIFFCFIAFLANSSRIVFADQANQRIQAVAIFAAMCVAVMCVLIALPDVVLSMQTRFLDASQSEDFVSRVFTIFAGEPDALKLFDWLGAGLGGGTNAAGKFLTGENTFMLAESEPGRVLLEAGLLGIFFTLGKVVVSSWGLLKACQIAMNRHDVLPLCLWLTIAYAFLTWSVIGQVSAHVLAFVLLTFGFASLRVDRNRY